VSHVTTPGHGRRHRRGPAMLFVAVGIAVASVVMAGCSQAINVEALEQELESQIAVQRGVGVSEVKVVCPATVDVAEGSVVECSAAIAGQPFVVTVTQTDGEGAMQWVITPDEAQPAPPADADPVPDEAEPAG